MHTKKIMTHQEFWEQKNASISKTKDPLNSHKSINLHNPHLNGSWKTATVEDKKLFGFIITISFFLFFFRSEVFLNNVFITICSEKSGPTCQNETCRFFRNFTVVFFFFGIFFWVISVLVFLRGGIDWDEVAYLI